MFTKVLIYLFNLLFSFLSGQSLLSAEHIKQVRISGGNVAEAKQFAFQVFLRLDNEFSCGAVIYNEHYIITAAHCVTTANGIKISTRRLKIVAGTTKLNDRSAQKFDVEKIIVHNRYRPSRNRISLNDIALVKLQKKLQFSDYIKPIDLYNGPKLTQGQTVTVSGWGRTSVQSYVSNDLRYAQMRSITPGNCFFATGFYSDRLLCLIHPRGILATACNGDSGGPATYNGKLVGIVSFGKNCTSSAPIGLTRVSYFSKWIKENAL